MRHIVPPQFIVSLIPIDIAGDRTICSQSILPIGITGLPPHPEFLEESCACPAGDDD
jgi:hypothetical protein